MRTLNLKNKMISVLFAVALMLQSCSVYKKYPASLDEAVKANARTIVFNTDDSKHEYTRVIQIDNEYYGEIKTISATKKVALSEADIKRIKVLDNNATTLRTVGIVVLTVGLVIAIISLSSLEKGLSFD
jgi:PBP1b-binding outer membrane lipoprotein LpoB